MNKEIARTNKIMYIVGQRIQKQLDMVIPNVLDYEQAIDMINSYTLNDRVEFKIGQGLSKWQISSLLLIARNHECGTKIFPYNYMTNPQICNKTVHKLKLKNTMISLPEKIDDDNYRSALFIDDECAEMSDHMTGCHIQGMVLIEAARQMINAVSDQFYIKDGINFFILNDLNAKFHHYIFPLDVELNYNIINIKHGLNGNFTAEAQIVFLQNNSIGATVFSKFQAMDSKIMGDYEKMLAKKSFSVNSSQSILGGAL